MKIEFAHLANTDTSTHVKVLADGKDVGVLYLSNVELDALLDLVRKGVRDSSTDFINSINVDDCDDDLDDLENL